jgi:hypothetical protein
LRNRQKNEFFTLNDSLTNFNNQIF